MKAIVIGASGATGKELVQQLRRDPRISQVVALLRRPFFSDDPKLRQEFIDFDRLHSYQELIRGDVLFSCLGTTLRDAGSKKNQWKVDHDYQLTAAALAKSNGVPSFVLLSSAGANRNSLFFYSRMKGKLEESVQSLDFEQLVVVQPGPIDRPDSTRTGEKIGVKAMSALNRAGLFKHYAPIH